MNIHLKPNVSAVAYVVTGALAMITAEVPVHNEENCPVEFSIYNQVIDPSGSIVTTTETRYRLGAGAEETILDELLRVKDPVNGLEGYTLRSLLRVGEQVADSIDVGIRIV